MHHLKRHKTPFDHRHVRTVTKVTGLNMTKTSYFWPTFSIFIAYQLWGRVVVFLPLIYCDKSVTIMSCWTRTDHSIPPPPGAIPWRLPEKQDNGRLLVQRLWTDPLQSRNVDRWPVTLSCLHWPNGVYVSPMGAIFHPSDVGLIGSDCAWPA